MSIKQSLSALIEESNNNPKLQGRLYVGVSLKENAKPSKTPILVPMPNKFKRSDEEMVCLVVKDPQRPYVEALGKSEITANLFDEVIGVGKLRRRLHGSNKAIGEFTKSFPIILCQDKVLEPLFEALGPRYLKTCRHLPIVVNLDAPIDLRKLKARLREVRKSTQIVLKDANFVSMHVGHTLMDKKKNEQNIKAAVDFAKKKWPTAKMHIKTPESASLPV